MPTALLVESAVVSVRDLMRSQFNVQLENVWATVSQVKGDHTITLEKMPDSRYYISDAIDPLQPPACFIVADDTEMLVEFQQGAAQRHSIIVGFVVDDIEVQRLQKKVWRYARAAYLTLHDQAVGNIHIVVRNVNYGPSLVRGAGDARKFRKDVTLRCDVLHFEV